MWPSPKFSRSNPSLRTPRAAGQKSPRRTCPRRRPRRIRRRHVSPTLLLSPPRPGPDRAAAASARAPPAPARPRRRASSQPPPAGVTPRRSAAAFARPRRGSPPRASPPEAVPATQRHPRRAAPVAGRRRHRRSSRSSPEKTPAGSTRCGLDPPARSTKRLPSSRSAPSGISSSRFDFFRRYNFHQVPRFLDPSAHVHGLVTLHP